MTTPDWQKALLSLIQEHSSPAMGKLFVAGRVGASVKSVERWLLRAQTAAPDASADGAPPLQGSVPLPAFQQALVHLARRR